MEENEKKYRAVRDAINNLFSDGYCHTLQEIADVTKIVAVTVVGKDKDGKVYERTIQIRSGFNDTCIKKLTSIALVRSVINDPDYPEIFEKTLCLPKNKDRKGRTPKFFLIAQAPKMNAKDKDNKRVITTRQIEICYDASKAVNIEAYAKEMEVKKQQFEELKAIKVLTLKTKDFPVQKSEVAALLPSFVKMGHFSNPKITRPGIYNVKIRFGKGMEHEVHIKVTPDNGDMLEEVNTTSETLIPMIPLEECIRQLKDKATSLGLICEITLK